MERQRPSPWELAAASAAGCEIGVRVTSERPPEPIRKRGGGLNREHWDLLISTAGNPRDQALIGLLLYTGISVSECWALDVGDLTLSANDGEVNIRHTPNGQARVLDLARAPARLLRSYLAIHPQSCESGAPLFLSRYQQRLSVHAIQRMIRHTGQIAGFKDAILPSTLRRSFATYLWERCGDREFVAESLGLRDSCTLRRYLARVPVPERHAPVRPDWAITDTALPARWNTVTVAGQFPHGIDWNINYETVVGWHGHQFLAAFRCYQRLRSFDALDDDELFLLRLDLLKWECMYSAFRGGRGRDPGSLVEFLRPGREHWGEALDLER